MPKPARRSRALPRQSPAALFMTSYPTPVIGSPRHQDKCSGGHACSCPLERKFALEKMSRVGVQFRFGEDFLPATSFPVNSIDRSTWRRASLDRTHVGVVPLKVIGIDFDFANRPGPSEFQDDPIVSRTAPAFCFPSVAHIFGATGHDQDCSSN